jgi:pimeloyl-ACP methyl ester carboxylesterase
LLIAITMLPNLRTLGTVGRELRALATAALAMPLRAVLPRDGFDPTAPHPIPVVFVHGLCGDPTNFLALRAELAAAGIPNFATFAYRPQFAYQRVVADLAATIEDVCRRTGAEQVDVVCHSLGGLFARGVAQSAAGARVRRLVTLGAPFMSAELAPQELAIFGASDPIVPPPAADGPRTSVVIVPDCAHLALLYDARVAATVVSFLRAPALRRLTPRTARAPGAADRLQAA